MGSIFLILPLLPVGETHLTVLLHHHPTSSHPPSQCATPSGSILSIILPFHLIHSSTLERTHARTRAVVFPPLGYPLLPTSQIGLGRLFWSFAWLVVVYLDKQQRTTTTVRYHPVTLTFTLITTIHSLGWLLLSLRHKLLLPGLLACLPPHRLDLGTYPPRLNLGIVLLQPPPLSSILPIPSPAWSGLVWSVLAGRVLLPAGLALPLPAWLAFGFWCCPLPPRPTITYRPTAARQLCCFCHCLCLCHSRPISLPPLAGHLPARLPLPPPVPVPPVTT